MNVTPQEFVEHWHSVARIARPRFFPDGWLRQAGLLITNGVTLDDLTLVAGWMRLQIQRSQNNERNAVPFNAASFGWVKMFGEFGASNQHENFLARLTLAEAQKKPCSVSARAVQPKSAGAGREATDEDRKKISDGFKTLLADLKNGGAK